MEVTLFFTEDWLDFFGKQTEDFLRLTFQNAWRQFWFDLCMFDMFFICNAHKKPRAPLRFPRFFGPVEGKAVGSAQFSPRQTTDRQKCEMLLLNLTESDFVRQIFLRKSTGVYIRLIGESDPGLDSMPICHWAEQVSFAYYLTMKGSLHPKTLWERRILRFQITSRLWTSELTWRNFHALSQCFRTWQTKILTYRLIFSFSESVQ